MTAKKKTTPSPTPKPASAKKAAPKDATEKARKQASAEIQKRIDTIEAGETAATPTFTSGAPAAEPVAPAAADGVPVVNVGEPAADGEGGKPSTWNGMLHIKSGKKAKGAKAPKAEKPAKAPKLPKAVKPKRVSALDAAAQILAKSDKPMRAVDMIPQMEAKGLWKSPGGKTPEATLYAAIIREISAKGKDARFAKHDRGLFIAPPTGKGA